MTAVWSDSFVEEGNLAVAISTLRKILGDDEGEHKYIETVARRGYRFVGDVKEVALTKAHLPVTAVSVRLSEEAQVALPRPDMQSSKAQKLYVEGRYFWNKRTEEGLRRSIEYFQQAIAEDADFALAYAGLADSYVLLDAFGVEPAFRAHPVAKAAALRALQLNDSLAEPHTSLAMACFYYEWNWSKAEEEFERAIALNPSYVLAHSWYALYLAAVGRCEEALKQVLWAQELDPVSLELNTVVGRILYLGRQYEPSINAYRRVIDLDPHYARAHTRLGMTYAAQGVFEEAVREFKESQRLLGSDAHVAGLLGYAEALAGNIRRGRKLLEELSQHQRLRRHFVPAVSLALINIGLGERDRALDHLEKAYADRSSDLAYVKAEPFLDPVRSEERFSALLRQMRLD